MATASKVPLTSELHVLAARFADDLLAAFAAQRLEDVLATFARARKAPSDLGARAGRPRRLLPSTRSPKGPGQSSSRGTEDRVAILARVVAAVAQSDGGVRAEELRKLVGLEKSAFAQAVRDGLATGEIRKEGELRGTRYFPAT